MSQQEERERVVTVARTFLRTPFHDGAAIKGVGVDCAQLLALVYTEAGLIPPQQIERYSPQFMLHRDEPKFEDYVRRFAHEVPTGQLADIVLYRVGRSFAHGGILSGPGKVIHAFKSFGFVVETGLDESDLRGRPRKFFSLWR